VRTLRELYPDLWFSVSVTTRDRRPGEVDGVDYHFVSDADFDRMIERDELLEWAEIHGGTHRSGTPRDPIERRLAEGRPALLELDLQGARAVRTALPDALLVFIRPPNWDELVHRLVGRGTEPPDVIARRLATAREELAAADEFDVELVNDDVHRAAKDLLTLMVGTRPDHHV
jgi:guanylate kinase